MDKSTLTLKVKRDLPCGCVIQITTAVSSTSIPGATSSAGFLGRRAERRLDGIERRHQCPTYPEEGTAP